MSAHRYWRLNFRASNGSGFVGVREVELRASIGGPDVTGSGTASASSSAAGTAASAFDNTTSEWAAAISGPPWLKYDFGVGNDKDIVEIQLTARGGSPDQAPTDFDLQWSDDDSSWTTLYSIQDSNWGAATTNTYSGTSHPTIGNATSKRFWRVQCSALEAGTVFSIAELEMFLSTDGSGTDLCTGGTAFSKTSFLESPIPRASRAFDDDGSTYAASSSATISTALPWVGYLFGAAEDVESVSIKIRPGSPAGGNQAPKNFTIQYWDGSAFQTFATLTNITGWTAGQKRYFAASGEISAPAAAQARPVVFIVC